VLAIIVITHLNYHAQGSMAIIGERLALHCITLLQGVLSQHQMEHLTDKELMDKHRTFRLNTGHQSPSLPSPTLPLLFHISYFPSISIAPSIPSPLSSTT
jgi:hypothetical protein